MMNISDEETIQMISDNLYIQYFLGFESFTSVAPFDSSLFVEIRKRMGIKELNRINDVRYQAAMGKWNTVSEKGDNGSVDDDVNEQLPEGNDSSDDSHEEAKAKSDVSQNRGRMLVDTTACTQVIAYSTDLRILMRAGKMRGDHRQVVLTGAS